MKSPRVRTIQAAIIATLLGVNLAAFAGQNQWSCENVWCPISEDLCMLGNGTHYGCEWVGGASGQCQDSGCSYPRLAD